MVSPMCEICGRVDGPVAIYDKKKTGVGAAHRMCLLRQRAAQGIVRSKPRKLVDGPGASRPIFERMVQPSGVFRRMVDK